MIDAIIFSKDRPMQLDALLRSMKKHCDRLFKAVTVLYKTAEGFEIDSGYDKLADEYWWVEFEWQWKFKIDFIKLVNNSQPLICLLVDDDIFFKDVDPFDLSGLLSEVDIASLRLGDNITKKPHFDYKSSLDGNIYRKDLLMKMVGESFSNPNELESKLAKHCKGKTMGWMNGGSRLIGIPANKVSDTSGCSYFGASVEELNDKFMDGWIIDFESMDLECGNVHKDEPYKFKKI